MTRKGFSGVGGVLTKDVRYPYATAAIRRGMADFLGVCPRHVNRARPRRTGTIREHAPFTRADSVQPLSRCSHADR